MSRGLDSVSKCHLRDFPDGSVAKNLTSSAGDMGSIPGLRTKIPHATGQLRLPASTRDTAKNKNI